MQTTTHTPKSGSLTIAGSGIAALAQMTLETVAYIKDADKVFYAVCDPLTQAFIRDNSKGDCHDLSAFYDKDKHRADSYLQMAEVMLREVRAGYKVLGVFYGHPGVFVSPSHRAMSIALAEGYEAKMLPGVSAEDCLFADLGIDPAGYGCMSCEASELLLRNRPLDPSVHNIIWQVGSIGVFDMSFNNEKFHLLVDRLEKDFGPDHFVINYVGGVLPQSDTTTDRFSIADLRKEEVIKQFDTISTMYIPPRVIAPVHPDMSVAFAPTATRGTVGAYRTSLEWGGPGVRFYTMSAAYTPDELGTIAEIGNHTTPPDHIVLHASPAVVKFMSELALSPTLLRAYKVDPSAVVEAAEGLSAREKFALKLGKLGPAYAVMTRTASGKSLLDGIDSELSEEQLLTAPTPKTLAAQVIIGIIIVF